MCNAECTDRSINIYLGRDQKMTKASTGSRLPYPTYCTDGANNHVCINAKTKNHLCAELQKNILMFEKSTRKSEIRYSISTKMAKRKAETGIQPSAAISSKKAKLEIKSNFLDDDSDSESDNSNGGAKLEEPEFKVNEEYAKRFEYNKKREELQKRECAYQII